MSDLTEVEQLRLQLTEAEASMLNLEWRLGEAKAAVTEETWRANRAEAALAELRPAAASEDWHREYGRVLVRVMRERDEARARVGTPPAQPTIPPDAELAEAVREWRGQFRPGSYMSPQAERLAAALDTQLADINAQVAADKRVLDAAGKLSDAVTQFLADGTEIIMHPDLWGPLSELMDATTYDGMAEPCQPIGCDNGYHLAGCVFAEVDSGEQTEADGG